MPRIPPGPPAEPGALDLERDRGARDLLLDLGRRDLAKDPGRRDLADDAGRIELDVLGALPEMSPSETFAISGGTLLLKKARARPPREPPGEKPVEGP